MPEAVVPALQATEDFSLIALFLRADIFVQIVMGILFLFSIWSLAIAFDKWVSISSARARAKKFEQAFWSGQQMDEASERVTDKPAEAMARVFSAGAREWRESRRGAPGDDASKAIVERASAQMDVAVNRETARMEAGLSTLAIIASSAPFIGLFGTVIGIMNSFREIAAQGETNLTVVAPGIAEALFATGLGLFAAIPALIFYNKFSSDVNAFSERLANFAAEVTVRLSRRMHERRDA